MSGKLRPHYADLWPFDLAEDYSRARNDDERRRMLLRFGYDVPHRSEAIRLFPECFEDVTQSESDVDVHHDLNKNEPRTDSANKLAKLKAAIGIAAAVLGAVGSIPGVISLVKWLVSVFGKSEP